MSVESGTLSTADRVASMSIALIGGTLLQLVGLAMAAIGVGRTRKQYGLPGIVKTLRLRLVVVWWTAFNWIRVHVLRRSGRKLPAEGRVEIRSSFGTPTLYRSRRFAPLDSNARVADQIAVLDRNFRDLLADVNEIQQLHAETDTRVTKVDERATERTEEVRAEAKSDLRDYATGGLRVEAWGLTITAVGTALAAIE